MAGEKILNIDDSPTVQRLIEMILSSQGYQVVLASDGEEGIAKAKSERPALILVDFVMPKMNGYQVCKTLKDDPEFRDTPIILVTSKGDKVGSKFVDVLGISEYFTKPFQPEELLSKIREVLDKKAQDDAAAKAAAAKSRPALATAPARGAAAPEGLEAMVTSIVKRILDDFVRNTLPELLRKEQGGGRGSAGIQGNLAAFRIVELMQMLALQRQSGRITITRREGEAEIFFKEGAVVFASTTMNGAVGGVEGLFKKSCRVGEDGLQHARRIADMTGQPLDGVLAQEKILDQRTFGACLKRHTESVVFKSMEWQDGEFIFDKTPTPVFANPVALKVDDLILEGTRRSDEWVLIQQKIPNFSIVFEPLIGNAEELTRRGLSDMDLKVFAMVDGRSTVQDIIEKAMLSDFDVAKSMFILLSVNLIRKKGSPKMTATL